MMKKEAERKSLTRLRLHTKKHKKKKMRLKSKLMREKPKKI